MTESTKAGREPGFFLRVWLGCAHFLGSRHLSPWSARLGALAYRLVRQHLETRGLAKTAPGTLQAPPGLRVTLG